MKTMNDTDAQSSFTALLASSIHDMKNALGMVINTLDLFTEDNGKPADTRQLALLQFEARRINDNLVQLLALYKSENNLLAPHIDEHDVEDFLDEVIAIEANVARAKDIELTVDCNDELTGYFDRDLVAGVIGNAIHNAIRHTGDTIRVTAGKGDDGSLVMQVIDNGQGIDIPLLADNSPAPDSIDYRSGGTGLGLHFCTVVAKLHTNRDKQGHISIENRKDAGGAVFTLFLP